MATYFIRQGTFAPQGPFEEARVAGYIAQGKLRAGAGMEISADGRTWVPVERHPLFAAAPPVRAVSGPPPVRAVQPVEEVEVVEEVPPSDPGSVGMRPRRRAGGVPSASAPKAGGGMKPWVIVGGLLLLGAAYNALKGKDEQNSSSVVGDRDTKRHASVATPARSEAEDYARRTEAELEGAFRAGERTTEAAIVRRLGNPIRRVLWDWSASSAREDVERMVEKATRDTMKMLDDMDDDRRKSATISNEDKQRLLAKSQELRAGWPAKMALQRERLSGVVEIWSYVCTDLMANGDEAVVNLDFRRDADGTLVFRSLDKVAYGVGFKPGDSWVALPAYAREIKR